MEELKRKTSFIDADGKRARLDIEITKRNGYPEFAIMGTYDGAAGQVIDDIKPANSGQLAIIALWRAYHLKDISQQSDFIGKLDAILMEIEAGEQAREAKAEKKTGDDAILEKMSEEGIDESQLEAVKAYISLGIESDDGLEGFEEAIAGQAASDEDFAQEIAEQIGAVDSNATWPNNCIDWEQAAGELMYDYSEADGYYFRNI
jgi:hypothetical protein